jgi:Transmembrane amino acid transporter protein
MRAQGRFKGTLVAVLVVPVVAVTLVAIWRGQFTEASVTTTATTTTHCSRATSRLTQLYNGIPRSPRWRSKGHNNEPVWELSEAYVVARRHVTVSSSRSSSNRSSSRSSSSNLNCCGPTPHGGKVTNIAQTAAVALWLRGGGGGNGRGITAPSRAATSRASTAPALASPQSAIGSGGGTLTSNRAVINLVKSIVGAAVFGLPAGVAAFGNAPSAILPALAILLGIGGLAAYGFDCIGTVCRVTRATTYKQAWSRTVGTRSPWMPATACFMVTVCTVLTYSVILADTIPAIVTTITSLLTSSSTWTMGRTSALLSVTLWIVYPLCRLQSLAALAPFSFLGICGMLFTGLCMAIRYLTGAYGPHGRFATLVAPHLYDCNDNPTVWRNSLFGRHDANCGFLRVLSSVLVDVQCLVPRVWPRFFRPMRPF